MPLVAVNDLPPLPDAIAFIVAGSAGTGTDSPWMVTVPDDVPNAMVSIGTCAAFAAAVACSVVASGDWMPSPIVGEPSLIKTMAAGAFCPSEPGGNAAIAPSALLIATPVAVPPPIVSALTAASTGAWSDVGDARTRACVSNDIRPILSPDGSPSMNWRAPRPARRRAGWERRRSRPSNPTCRSRA